MADEILRQLVWAAIVSGSGRVWELNQFEFQGVAYGDWQIAVVQVRTADGKPAKGLPVVLPIDD